ncbi:MAG: DNA mismatch repair protein MutS [Rhodobacteraceae bacterium]|nr:DNA mismatch repair protein MutS [Paracoccaceae bacterium]
MRRRRTLRPEEEDLWRSVARTARPLHDHPIFHKAVEAPPVDPAPLTHAKPRLPAFTLGEKVRATERHDLAPSLPQALGQAPLQMDAKTHGRMTRGKLAPEARIDLHGLTLAEAHPELIRFILNAHGAGLRLVLVITGKGKEGQGILRRNFLLWLESPPARRLVSGYAESHPKHGGAGAFYVVSAETRLTGALFQQHFCDLNSVQCCALSQIVARHEQRA